MTSEVWVKLLTNSQTNGYTLEIWENIIYPVIIDIGLFIDVSIKVKLFQWKGGLGTVFEKGVFLFYPMVT